MNTDSTQAIEILLKGGVIVYPTDTACGIGCRIDDDAAVRRVYEIKGRDLGKAVPVLCSSVEMVKRYIESVTPEVERLMHVYWPGALTLVVLAKDANISPLVLGENKTIGVRIPGDERIREIIERVGVPIVGTSANLAGEATTYNTNDLSSTIRNKVDFVLEGECVKKQSSTVVETTNTPFRILRAGAVKLPELRA
jgi:L-threonylcarbamoyladenylate synthase